jgi:hypothetical protein
MRRRLSLALLAVLVVLAAVTSVRNLSPRARAPRKVAASGAPRDTLARLDSATSGGYRENPDTMCLASRIGLPCDPR